LPSLVNIAAEFETDYALVSIAVSGYLLVTAVLQIMLGPLSDRFGRRPVLIGALLLFTLASLGSLLSQNIQSFLAFRMMQGVIIAGAALSPAIVRDMLPPEKAVRQLGIIAMAMAVAPVLGPVLGGALDELFGWRAGFAVFAILGAGLFLLIWLDLAETNTRPSETFDQALTAYRHLLTSGRFWGYASCMAFSTGAFYAFLAGAPLVATLLFGMSTGELGLYLGTITGGFFFGSFIAARYSGRYPITTIMLAGRIVACAGQSVGVVLFLAGVVHAYSFFGATVFVGIGNGITMPGSSVGAMSVRPDLAGSASGLAGALTVAGGAVLTFVSAMVVTEESGALALLGVMFAASFLALVAVVRVAKLERGGAQPQ
jgi:MFS transporter, DHA1 family, multidrug resistance protein